MIDSASTPLARGRVAWLRRRGRRGPTDGAPDNGGPRLMTAIHLWWLPALIGFALGRAAVFGVLVPFGSAFCVALAAQGRARRAAAAAMGALIGGWTIPSSLWASVPGTPWTAPLPLVGMIVALAALKRRRGAGLAAAAGAWVAGALRLGIVALVGGDLLAAGVTAAAELAAAIALLPAAGLFGARPAPLRHGQIVSLLALTGFSLIGLEGIGWQGFALASFLARALVLLASLVGGPGFGAAAGAGLGIATFLTEVPLAAFTRPVWAAAVLPAAGLLAGLGALGGKPGAAAGLLVGHLLLTPLAGTGLEIGTAIFECLVAAGCLALVPNAALRRWAERLPGTPERERLHREGEREARARAEEQLQRVAAVFAELSQTFTPQDGAGQEQEKATDRYVARVIDAVCRGCSQYRLCWERHGYETFRDLLDAAAAAGREGQLSMHVLPSGLRQRCIKPPQLAKAVARVVDAMRVEAYWRTRLEASRELVPRQLAGIASIIAGVADQMERIALPAAAAAEEQSWAPRYDVDVSVLQTTPDPDSVSGDCFRRVDLGPGKVAFLLSDGMGTGPRAAAESEAAVAMLQRFLEAGFDLEFAVNTINSVLLLRSSDETYATLDACLVDLTDGTVQMLKVGAAPSFVRRGQEVEVVRAANLPVGILTRVDTEVVTRRLEAGDIVVMVTDGALAACRARGDREEALRRTVERVDPPDAQRVVDLLSARLRSRANPAEDDITVVAFQLAERGRRPQRQAEPRLHWRPSRRQARRTVADAESPAAKESAGRSASQ
ncbi:MAG: hypothetical protein BAA04_00280 [Firmicutes bacterium ZCTH02-B6]|nr:MAG: hypothetical protein BAA04_00280 [Firmicutes bacterium ZCTH02-B6]